MNSERKKYPMKEFRAIFSISWILVIRSWNAKKDHFSILAVFQNVWYLHKFWLQIWIQNAKITLWKNFGQFFRFHQFWSSGPQKKITCEKRPVFNISCNFKIYAIYINLGCRFEFRTQKLPYERISGNFSDFIDFVIRSGYAERKNYPMKKDHFSILAVFQNICDLHKFGLQIWIQNAKITLWKNFGQFFRFHRFWSSGPGMQKRSHLNISCNSKNMGLT